LRVISCNSYVGDEILQRIEFLSVGAREKVWPVIASNIHPSNEHDSFDKPAPSLEFVGDDSMEHYAFGPGV
jgi:hypothetical protein